MSTTTSGDFKLIKYDLTDAVSPTGYNSNFDTIDSQLTILSKDYVVDQGTSGIWYYRKWLKGRIELFGWKTISVQSDTAWENIYYDATVFGGDAFPESLNLTNPQGIVGINSASGNYWILSKSNATATKTETFQVASAKKYSSTTSVTVVYNYWGSWS